MGYELLVRSPHVISVLMDVDDRLRGKDVLGVGGKLRRQKKTTGRTQELSPREGLTVRCCHWPERVP